MKPLATCFLTILLGVATLSIDLPTASANEIGFVEEYALADDRNEALKQLIPGSEDYYFFHCLHLQTSGAPAKVEPLLREWIKRHGTTDRTHQILRRQAMLNYPSNGKQALAYLERELSLHFHHRRQVLDSKPTFPTRLDPKKISRDTLTKRHLRANRNLGGFTDIGLRNLDAVNTAKLDPVQRRSFLERLAYPETRAKSKGLADLIAKDLDHKGSRGFGSLNIHRQLLLTQLDELLELKPDLLNDRKFIDTYLMKLQPSPDVDWRSNDEETLTYLKRMEAFVNRLRPAHNSLRTHVLYHRLAFDRAQGTWDRARFMEYIQLPRNCSYINPIYLRKARHTADLGHNCQPITLLPPVLNDEPLVRDYLAHFFIKDTSYKAYESFITVTFLKPVFAEAKLLGGIGDAQRWYSLLSPSALQQLRDRVDIDFAATNDVRHREDDAVTMDVDIKNVSTLIVKVYEINTENYYRNNRREVNTDINLDGLVANVEQTHEYNESPLKRVRRSFEFPELKKAGIYVIDFIGNGMSSRAVIRKGQRRYLASTTSAGQAFTVLNEDNQPVKDATIWMDGQTYTAGGEDEGRIVVPFSTSPGQQTIVITHDGWSSLHTFGHQGEDYQLAAGMHVDRESLLQHGRSMVLVRAALKLNGQVIHLSALENPRLTIRSTDLDGIQSTKDVADFKLSMDKEATYEFHVPPRLAQLQLQLAGEVKQLSTGETIDVAATQSYALNEIDRSAFTSDLHLAEIDGEYTIEYRGRSGEVLADRPVVVNLHHREFTNHVSTQLQTDSDGRIYLGPITDIKQVTAHVATNTGNELRRTWHPQQDEHTQYRSLHAIEDKPIRVPLVQRRGRNPDDTDGLVLYEYRAGLPTRDASDAIQLSDGFVTIDGLTAGDYVLRFDSGKAVNLRVTKGKVGNGYGLGKNRLLEIRGRQQLHITNVEANDDIVTLQLTNVSKYTRLHVFATRYLPAHNAYQTMANVGDVEPIAITWPSQRSFYAAGRDIGDEYRYIIDRKYASKYPGNMLSRPSMILNPWAIRDTQTGQQFAGAGGGFAASDGEDAPTAAPRPGSSKPGKDANAQSADLDFLGKPSVVLANLRPDKNGQITIERELLGAHQHLHFVAVDPMTTVYRAMSLSARKMPIQDLRLIDGLDPSKHFMRKKQISLLGSGETFVVDDIVSSKYDYYDSLAAVHGLFTSLTKNANLAEFEFTTRWHALDDDEKRAKYSEFACHELHFFLYHKDRDFFNEVVRDYLGNKLNPTFLDNWLLNDGVAQHRSPWNYGQLNIAERILLGAQVNAETTSMKRHINELFAVTRADLGQWNRRFGFAIAGRALEGRFAGAITRLSRGRNSKRKKNQKLGELRALSSSSDDGLGVKQSLQGGGSGGGAMYRRSAIVNEAAVSALSDETESKFDSKAVHDFSDAADSYNFQVPAGQEEMDVEWEIREELGRRSEYEKLYRKLEATREWVENNYYHLPIEQQNAQLVRINAFWNAYANQVAEQAGEANNKGQFLSTDFQAATGNFTEMMLAMSVLDLPFEAGKHEETFDEAKLTIKAASPMVVFHEQVREVPGRDADGTSPVLISQNFFRHGDRHKMVNGQQQDKFLTDEFLIHAVYGCQVAITNTSSSPQQVDVLLQVPVGAIPVLGSRITNNVALQLPAYSTQTQEYYFYFPAAGDLKHFPVHVSQEDQLVAHADAFTFHVVDKPSKIDKTSWSYISQYGSDGDVLAFLRKNNLQELNLDEIAFRMQDKEFFLNATKLLAKAHVYSDTLWAYSVKHDSPSHIREFLNHRDGFVQGLGQRFDSELVVVNPIQRKWYQHMDYRPLVNARAHQLGRDRTILNDRFRSQYQQLMWQLSYDANPSQDDLMAVTYYMLLQDRVEEAIDFFSRVRRENIDLELQYDYFAAYLDCYQPTPDTARAIAAKYANHPVDRWRDTFASLQAMLDELDGKAPGITDDNNREQQQTDLAAKQPTFEFKVESKTVSLEYQNLKSVTVNYYLMDLELLFSRNPFVQQFSGQFSSIRPNLTKEIELPVGEEQLEFALPKALHNQNVLVEIRGGGKTDSQAYYSNALTVQTMENYGQLRVTHQTTKKPLSTVYVKVYAQVQDGSVKFYKDGYTDLRGRFDYTSLSTGQLDSVNRFSLLILSEDHGAIVREAQPPKQ